MKTWHRGHLKSRRYMRNSRTETNNGMRTMVQSGGFRRRLYRSTQQRGNASVRRCFPSSLSNKMSYKRVVDSKRARREEAIREAVALTSRELTKEDQRVVSSSGS